MLLELMWLRPAGDVATSLGDSEGFLRHTDVSVVSTGHLHFLAEVLGAC